MLAAFGYGAEVLPVVCGQGGILEQDLREAEDCVHGCADLVRHVGQEHALGLTGAPDAVDQRPLAGHVTEDPHDALELALVVEQRRGAHAEDDLLSVPVDARHLARGVGLPGALDLIERAILGVADGLSVCAKLVENLAAELADHFLHGVARDGLCALAPGLDPPARIHGGHSVGDAAQNILGVVLVDRELARQLLGAAPDLPMSQRVVDTHGRCAADGFDEGHLLGREVAWGGGDQRRDADRATARDEREPGVAHGPWEAQTRVGLWPARRDELRGLPDVGNDQWLCVLDHSPGCTLPAGQAQRRRQGTVRSPGRCRYQKVSLLV